MKFDFSGYATKNNIRCSDGRTIMHDAFKEMDGKTVPLVWQHMHDNPENVLGHALLENRDNGVYCYCSLNDTPAGENVKALLKHGDIDALSIYANQLVQKQGKVMHGTIREVSVVLAGANPGALIDNVAIKHSDGAIDELADEAVITSDDYICHTSGTVKPDDEDKDKDENNDSLTDTDEADSSDTEDDDSDDKTIQDVWDTFTEDEKAVAYYLIGTAIQSGDGSSEAAQSAISHADGIAEELVDEAEDTSADKSSEGDGPTIQEVWDSMSEEKKNVVYYLIGQALKNVGKSDNSESEDSAGNNQNGGKSTALNEGESSMKHNVFENDGASDSMTGLDRETALTLLHDAMSDTQLRGSFKDSVIAHADQYGIKNIDVLFPDAKLVTQTPDFIKRNTEWVDAFVNSLHKSPFSRIKSFAADLTEDTARAKGYIKGKQKIEEIFGVSKRVTTPQTIYKKQKLDRDDVLDITDFDNVVWLKAEMQMMLREEVARAVLIGDGRTVGAENKIDEQHIRPIWTDDELYTIHKEVKAFDPNVLTTEQGSALIKAIISSMDDYEGNGTPTFYASPATITALLLLEDKIGRRLFNNLNDLASALGVAAVVKVPVFKGAERTVSGNAKSLVGIIVNPADYFVGADKGGELNFFDDFDIDFNQYKYLYETRMSGALVHPKTAIALEAPKA